MARPTSESGTITRKPDDAVGSEGNPAAGDGHQTAEQAAITGMGSGGKDDASRHEEWGKGKPGSAPPAIGGSSGGHSDQQASQGPEAGHKVADGLSRPEKEPQR